LKLSSKLSVEHYNSITIIFNLVLRQP